MRIGDLLLEKGLVNASAIASALAAGREGRLCSVLIARGVLEFDVAARALGVQRGVPAALERHLEHRDPALASLLPSDFARARCALPIGRTSGGAVIVAARDPDAALRSAVERLVGSVTLVVTPATRLEQLLAAAYGEAPRDELDLDFDPAAELLPLAPPRLPPLPDLDLLDPDSVQMALSSLDDVRVAKDVNQSGVFKMPTRAASASPKNPPVRALLRAAPRITASIEALERTPTRDAAIDLAMSFIAGRWLAGAIFAVRNDTAIGYRGHGVTDLAEFHLTLRLPSTISHAVQTAQLQTVMPSTPAQEQLARLLRAQAVVAAPVIVQNEVVAVVAAGDSIHGFADADAPNELGRLAYALGEAWDRIRRG